MQDFPAIGDTPAPARSNGKGKQLTARATLGVAWASRQNQQPRKPTAWAQVVKGASQGEPSQRDADPKGTPQTTPTLGPSVPPTGLTPALASLTTAALAGAMEKATPQPSMPPEAPLEAPAASQQPATTAEKPADKPAEPAEKPRRILTAADMVRSGCAVVGFGGKQAALSLSTDSSPHSYVAAAAMRVVKQVSAEEAAAEGEGTATTTGSDAPAPAVDSAPAPAVDSTPREPKKAAVKAAKPLSEIDLSSRTSSPVRASSPASQMSVTSPTPDCLFVEAIEADAVAVDVTDAPKAEAADEAPLAAPSPRRVLSLEPPEAEIAQPKAVKPTRALQPPPPPAASAEEGKERSRRGKQNPKQNLVPPAGARSSPYKRSSERVESPTEGRGKEGARAEEQPRAHKHKKQATGGERRERTGNSHGLRMPPPMMMLPAPPPMPPATRFENCAASLPLPSPLAVEALDRALADFHHRTRDAAASLDGPATEMMGRVQAAVREVWPGALVHCFGSRATGLAGANSDVDLVVTGVPGLDAPPDGSVDLSNGPMRAQVDALHRLLPRLSCLDGVATASVNKSAVPVIALTAEPATTKDQEPTASSTAEAPTAGAEAEVGSEAAAVADAPTGGTATPAAQKATLCMDLSLHSAQHRGLMAAQHVRWLHSHLPFLPPLVMLLKALLHRHGLKTTYTGGLSSYALVMMVSRFLLDRHGLAYTRPAPPAEEAPPVVAPPTADDAPKASAAAPSAEPEAAAPSVPPEAAAAPSAPWLPAGLYMQPLSPSLGALLFELLSFYGEVFDPQRHAVLGSYGAFGAPPPGFGFVERQNVGPLVSYTKSVAAGQAPRAHMRAVDPFHHEPLVCVDPVDLVNNTGKSCYRVGQLQKLFMAAARAAAKATEAEAEAMRRGEQPQPGRLIDAILAAEE